jgi:hypothetical protein
MHLFLNPCNEWYGKVCMNLGSERVHYTLSPPHPSLSPPFHYLSSISPTSTPLSSIYLSLNRPICFLLSPYYTLTHSLCTSPLCLPLSPSHTLAQTLFIPPLCLPLSPSHTPSHTFSIPPLCIRLSSSHTLTHSLYTSILCLPLSTSTLSLLLIKLLI